MAAVHRNNDSRSCGARTKAQSSRVFVNNQPVSIEDDPNTHGGGALIASVSNVRVNNKKIIVLNDSAKPDAKCPGPNHCNPKASSASSDVYAG
jgi:uncharacterized Zn-binding protein involved in type VI secretion